MKVYGRAAVGDFLQDNLIYRSIRPVDTRLPALDELRARLRLSALGVPRKTSVEYATVLTHLLGHARNLEAPGTTLNRLVFVGDNRLNDVTTFNNLCMAADWPGAAFICAENLDEPPHYEVIRQEETRILYFANRWGMLRDFDYHLNTRGFALDERTVVLLNLDRTALGARGRNDAVIDAAQMAAAFGTARALLGGDFDPGVFERAYSRFSQPAYHAFTTDNQDHLVYLCLMISAGLYTADELDAAIRGGQLFRFDQFLRAVDARADRLPAAVRAVHEDFAGHFRAGDPAPFKAFRENEYRETVARMGQMGADAPVEEILAREIVLTQEVRERAADWHFRGSLLFGVSDRPDEASLPPADLAREGYQPIHRTLTDAVGEQR